MPIVMEATGLSTLLDLKTRFYRFLGQQWAGTATGGSTTKLTDSALIDQASDEFPTNVRGKYLRITGGNADGDIRRIVDGPNASGDLEVNRAFSAAVASTDTYQIFGNSIHPGQQLTDLFNDALQVARPYTSTELTIVDRQNIYDVSDYIRDESDIRRVTVRNLDPANERPHTPWHPVWWRVSREPDAATGVMEWKLETIPALVDTTPATQELWIHHYTTLTAFVDDTSTVDEQYLDWLAWEAVLLHCLGMMASNTDKGRWQEMTRLASAKVGALRNQFSPYVPSYIRHERPQVQ